MNVGEVTSAGSLTSPPVFGFWQVVEVASQRNQYNAPKMMTTTWNYIISQFDRNTDNQEILIIVAPEHSDRPKTVLPPGASALCHVIPIAIERAAQKALLS